MSIEYADQALLKTLFAQCDTDRDGFIDRKSLMQICRSFNRFLMKYPMKKRLIYQTCDQNGGLISLKDLVRLFGHGPAADDKELYKAFLQMDRNGDGLISPVELKLALQAMGEDPSDEEVREIIREVDLDGDGCIDFEEFKQLLI